MIASYYKVLGFHFHVSRGEHEIIKKMNTNSKSMTGLGAVVETIPNHRWAAIGKGLLASGLLDKHTFEQQWDSESRSSLFINVLTSVGNPSRPPWKQLVKVLQVQLGYDHELITLVKEVTRDCDQVREQSHGYGTTALWFKDGKEFHRDSGEETDNPSTPLLPNSQGSKISDACSYYFVNSGDALLQNRSTLCDG